MTPRELRATLDCLDLSAAEAPARRAPSYGLPLARRLHVGADRGRAAAASDGAAWNPANGGDRVASWSDKRKAAVGPIAGEIDKADCPPQYTCQVQAGRGAGSAEPAAWRDHCGHDAGDRLAVPFGVRFPGRGGTQEARADAAIRQDGGRARLSRDPHRRDRARLLAHRGSSAPSGNPA